MGRIMGFIKTWARQICSIDHFVCRKVFCIFPWDTGKFTQYSLAIYSIVDAID